MPKKTQSQKIREIIFEELQEIDPDISEDFADTIAERLEKFLDL